MNKKTILFVLLSIIYTLSFAQTDDQCPETDPIITNRISQ